MQLRRSQVEAEALQAVEAVLAGGRVEDARIECKADWPDENKARQLAGHANTARGEPIIWLVGVDEKNHSLTRPSPIDPADWWSRMSKRFDQAAPEMFDVTVHLGEGRTVTALAFMTDQVPYVVTAGGEEGRVEREVPVRAGTRTRSAYRHELLRMLFPSISIPQSFITAAVLQGSYEEEDPPRGRLSLWMRLFFEFPGGTTTMLPANRMQARLDFDVESLAMPASDSVRMFFETGEYSTSPKTFGVQGRSDGIVITGPGATDITAETSIDPAWYNRIYRVRTVQMRCSLGIAGSDRRLQLSAILRRGRSPGNRPEDPVWGFEEPLEDPWDPDEGEPEGDYQADLG